MEVKTRKKKIGGMSGLKHSEETKRKMSLASKGRQKSEAHRKHLSEAFKGRKGYWTGKKRLSMTGKNNWRWVEDRGMLKDDHRDRCGQLSREWSKSVKQRDNQKCKINNSDCEGRLEAHHILGWSSHPELRYQLNNGITLCHFHHPRARKEEKRLIPTFKELVSVSK